MKTLILVRHAKSSWDDSQKTDSARPLNKRGLKDAPEMGSRLRQAGIYPDKLITSPATRALTTAKLLAQQLNYPPKKIEQRKSLYGANVQTWLSLIGKLKNHLNTVMMVGHNPGLNDLLHYFGFSEIDNMPTSGVLSLTFESDAWEKIPESVPLSGWFDFPKNSAEDGPRPIRSSHQR